MYPRVPARFVAQRRFNLCEDSAPISAPAEVGRRRAMASMDPPNSAGGESTRPAACRQSPRLVRKPRRDRSTIADRVRRKLHSLDIGEQADRAAVFDFYQVQRFARPNKRAADTRQKVRRYRHIPPRRKLRRRSEPARKETGRRFYRRDAIDGRSRPGCSLQKQSFNNRIAVVRARFNSACSKGHHIVFIRPLRPRRAFSTRKEDP